MIYSKRLELRSFEKDDKDFLFELNNNALVNEFRPNKSVTMAYCQKSIKDWNEKYKNGFLNVYRVALKDSKEAIGLVGLYESHGQIEIGYRFLPSHWRKGYCTESLKTLVDIYFKENEGKSIMAETHEENTKSIELLKKNGFVEKIPQLENRGKMLYLYDT